MYWIPSVAGLLLLLFLLLLSFLSERWVWYYIHWVFTRQTMYDATLDSAVVNLGGSGMATKLHTHCCGALMARIRVYEREKRY
jgi:hypothetical protein